MSLDFQANRHTSLIREASSLFVSANRIQPIQPMNELLNTLAETLNEAFGHWSYEMAFAVLLYALHVHHGGSH